MGVPRHDYDPRRLFIFSCPNLPLSKHQRAIGVYLAGVLFALAHWTFWDACILSAHAHPPADAPYDTPPVHVTFLDWTTGICSTLGVLIVNSINKDQLRDDGSSFGGGLSSTAWRARLILFLGFALMAGGLAGSASLLVLKYIIQHYEDRYLYYGYANVAQNVLLMLSAIVLWLAQQVSSEYDCFSIAFCTAPDNVASSVLRITFAFINVHLPQAVRSFLGRWPGLPPQSPVQQASTKDGEQSILGGQFNLSPFFINASPQLVSSNSMEVDYVVPQDFPRDMESPLASSVIEPDTFVEDNLRLGIVPLSVPITTGSVEQQHSTTLSFIDSNNNAHNRGDTASA